MASDPASVARRSERALPACALAASAGLLLFLALPFLSGRILVGDDLGLFHLPLRGFLADCLSRGESADWIPHLHCGMSLLGEGQVATLHPLQRLLYAALPLPAAFGVEVLWPFAFGFAGTLLWLRRLGLGAFAAALGGFLFAFSGTNALRIVHPNALAILSHLPWLLLGGDVLLRGGSARARLAATVGVPCLTASQLLLGHPQFALLSALTEGAYAIFVGSRAGWRGFARFAAAKLLGAGLGAAQALPQIEAVRDSFRDAPWAAWRHGFALRWESLLQLPAPYLVAGHGAGPFGHESAFHAGAVVPGLLGLAWVCRRELGTLRPLVGAALAWSAVGVLGATAAFASATEWLPVLGQSRVPTRSLALANLPLAAMAAFGAEAVLRRSGSSHPRRVEVGTLAVVVGVAALAVALALLARRAGAASWVSPPSRAIVGLVLVACATGLLALSLRRPAFLGLVPALAAVDLGHFAGTYPAATVSEAFETYRDSVPVPPGEPRDRILAAQNRTLLHGWSQAHGYVALVPRRRLDYDSLVPLRVAGVRWVRRGIADERFLGGGLKDGPPGWLEAPDPLPRARLVGRAVASADPRKDLASIPIEEAALVEAPLPLPAGPAGDAEIVGEAPGRIRIAVRTTVRRLLVVAESFHRDWRAAAAGRPVPTLRVNGDFLGCVVEPGDAEVEFRFRSRTRRIGTAVGGACAALLVVQAIAGRRARRAPSAAR